MKPETTFASGASSSMIRLTLLAAFSIMAAGLQAQSLMLCDFQARDSIEIVANEEGIDVWDFDACALCSATFRTSLSVSADSIVIVQTDTAGQLALCECLFDLRASIRGISQGTYGIAIYREYLKKYGYSTDTRLLVKSLQVSYQYPSSSNLSWSAFQSACRASSVSDAGGGSPGQFILLQNYPNPFNPGTTLRFQTPGAEYVVIKLYDLLGREVQTLWAQQTPAGQHELRFELHPGLSSGTYLCRMDAGSTSQTIKVVLVR